MEKYPKVLVISHTVFSANGNMGRTMADFFSSFPSSHLSQLYFHSEVPTIEVCDSYYRVTDKDVLKSVFTRKPSFRIFGREDIQKDRASSRTDRGFVAKIYQFSRRRTPIIYFARNLMWKLGVWKSKKLEDWVQQYDPDVIFFAAGDYSFAYRVVDQIAQKQRIPVVMWCCDDHYLNEKKNSSFLYRYNKKELIFWAKKIAKSSTGIITISDKMKKDYSELFQMEADVLRISAKQKEGCPSLLYRQGIVYAGNLGVRRLDALIDLGKAVKAAQIPGFNKIDVYSGERDPRRLEFLTEENGIMFHGAVPQGELAGILQTAKYLVHVESFDEEAKMRTRYSLSTKIGESLVSHALLIGYGPQDISSMEYLKEHNAAVMIEHPEEFPSKILYYNEHPEEYQRVVLNAIELAEKYHNKALNDHKLIEILTREQGSVHK